MKCKCPSETHGHEAGKCNNLASEPDRMCKPCHDKVAKEMHVARRLTTSHPSINHGGNARAVSGMGDKR
jgi:hypothetical protein